MGVTTRNESLPHPIQGYGRRRQIALNRLEQRILYKNPLNVFQFVRRTLTGTIAIKKIDIDLRRTIHRRRHP